MDTGSSVVRRENEDIHSDISKDVETWFDTSIYKLNRPLLKEKNKKSNWINEKWIRQENNDKYLEILNNLQIFNI